MAERKIKRGPVSIQNMEQLLTVVEEVVRSNDPVPIELQNGLRVKISPEPRSMAVPANGVAFTPEEIAERLAVIERLAGVWADIDGEAWKKRIKTERGSNRPIVDFDR